MKETDWFPLTVLPVRVGVYYTRHRGTNGTLYEGYSFWSGQKWGYTYSTPFKSPYEYPSTQQSREWKGIYKETS